MPIDYKKYDKDWNRISKAIVHRAKGCCELCGVGNHQKIRRLKRNTAKYISAYTIPILGIEEDYKNVIEVVLTVHHINFDIRDNRPVNLIALCQRCHLRLDLPNKLSRRARSEK